ncbi:MAG: large conductance mechanosensitive channel protein MscL [Aggregatilineales bacterium]
MLKEFRAFLMRGNVIDLAVAFILGVAFIAIVTSLVGDIIMPVISLVTGRIDFANLYIPLAGQPYGEAIADAKKAGAVIAYGSFLTAVINFVIIAFVVFLIVRAINHMVRKPPPPPAAPPPPTKEEQLLTEIRDLLKTQPR